MSLRQELIAATYPWITRAYERGMRERRKHLCLQAQGRVLEIGPGIGTNLLYLTNLDQWIGLEPSNAMLRRLADRTKRTDYPTESVRGSSEAIPFPDESFDTVLTTLVLCSVTDPLQTLTEIKRVLRPGGRFLFMEHVAAPIGSRLRKWQATIRSPWQWLADGCQTDRETDRLIDESQFTSTDYERLQVPVPLAPRFLSPHIVGTASR